MIDKHINFTPELNDKVEKFCEINKIQISEAVRNLIEVGLSNITYSELLDTNNKQLDRIYGRLGYIVDLVEQFYADMDIDNHIDIKTSKSIIDFKNRRYNSYDK